MQKNTTKRLVLMGLLIGIEIVLSRFCSISAWNIKIGFSFVPVALAGMLAGPLAGGLVAGLGDFVGAILFPVGPYFPGFTLTAFGTGVVFGLFLHKRRSVPRLLGAVAVNQLVLSLLMNTLWISILYTSPYLPLLSTRVLQCAVVGPTQFVVVGAMSRLLERYGKQALA